MTILQTFLADLVKAALVLDDAASLRWRDEARRVHAVIASDPSAVAGLKIDGIWTLAVREAEAPAFRASETRVSFTLPVACPFSLADITDPGFDIDAGVERIVGSASTG